MRRLILLPSQPRNILKKNVLRTQLISLELRLQKGVNYLKYLYSEKIKSWYQGYNLTREYIVPMNRVRANHYNLAESSTSEYKCKFTM